MLTLKLSSMVLYNLTLNHIEDDKEGSNAYGDPHGDILLELSDQYLHLLFWSGGGKGGQERLFQRNLLRGQS